MRRPGPTIAVMFGMPHDEDSLDREGDDDGGPAAAATIGSIVHRLQRGGPAAVRDLRKFTAALEDLADAYMERDHETFEEAANIARDALNDLIEE